MYKVFDPKHVKLIKSNDEINVIRTTPVYLEKMAAYGYDEPKLQEGSDFVAAAKESHLMKKEGQGNRMAARIEFTKRQKELNITLRRHEAAALTVLAKYPELLAKIGWNQSRARMRKVHGWFARAKQLYEAALNSPEIMALLAVVKMTEDLIKAALQAILDLEAFFSQNLTVTVDAKKKTIEQNAKFENLDRFMVNFQKVARAVFFDDPIAYQRLGFAVRSKRRKKTVEPTTGTAATTDNSHIPMPTYGGLE